MLKKYLILLLIICFSTSCFGFSFKRKKKQKPVVQKMVETKQDWEKEAQNVNLEQRKLNDFQPPKSDKKHYYPEIKYVFERYNYPAGSREVNIDDIKKNLVSYPFMAVDLNIHYGAYSRFYYNPENNQISSEIFVEKLDTLRTKQDRIINYHHEQKKRTPVLSSGTNVTYKNLYNGLTVVDWDKSSNKVLIKEKIGSTLGGIYQTNLYVYFLDKNKTVKLSRLHDAIHDYLLDYQDLQISNYRYDIKPLGFSAEDENKVIALAFVLDNKNNKIFLGAWQYNCLSGEIRLLSDVKSQYNIASSALFLRRAI